MKGSTVRKWLRFIHRDFSFFFSGVIIIYAVSGIMLNHRHSINPNYTVKRQEIKASGEFPMPRDAVSKQDVLKMLEPVKEGKNYTKHYFPEPDRLKIFLKGGSSMEVDMTTGEAVYEALKKRPLISQFNRLHYNPGHWWTVFSDTFAASLIVITLTGIFMNKGKKWFWGRGGIELLAGILIPLSFMIFM